MTKDELNRKWAELEGWKFNLNSIEDLKPPPDFTEPNRFFAEVVPRMVELGLCFKFDNFGCVHWTASIESDVNVVYGHSNEIGEAGLAAAIKAKEELDVK